MQIFKAADLLLPQGKYIEDWPVIACDQFTSQPEYWEAVRRRVGDRPSSYRVIFPEAELGPDNAGRIALINSMMRSYLASELFCEYKNSYIYVERTLMSGVVRRGVVGVIDLEAYDYTPLSSSPVRATEKTVPERIPPRVEIRKNAAMELSHILLLCDDAEKKLIVPMTDGELLYDMELMQGGGRIKGWLVDEDAAKAFGRRLDLYYEAVDRSYAGLGVSPIYFAVGDGNHSLAAAKACWEELKASDPELAGSGHPARYAMVELENLYDEAQQFEPIHRIVSGTDPGALIEALNKLCVSEGGHPIRWYSGDKSGTLTPDRALGELPVAVLQNFLDGFGAGSVDYIHGAEVAEELAKRPDTVAFLLPPIYKDSLFKGIAKDGVLPRKTFSMGHAQEKRYYMECRRIR